MSLRGAQLNPLFRTSQFTRIFKEYKQTTKGAGHLFQEDEDSKLNPNSYSSEGPHQGLSASNPVKLGRNPDDSYGDVPEPEFQSGTILIDPELRLLAAMQQERNLLAKAGLKIQPMDDVRVIKDINGNVKGAMAINRTKNMGQVMSIKYIDVDKDGENFKKALSKLITSNGSPIKTFENATAEITRCRIPLGLIKD